MAQYNFEGDLENVSSQQLEFINNVIKENELENSKVTFEPVGKAGDNYIASVKRIIIEGDKKTLKLIAKLAPTNEFQRQLMNTQLLFMTEHVMYSEVLPKFIQIQKDANIPESEHLRYAKWYGSSIEQPNEIILLEDLNTSDFTMLDRFKPLSDECIKSILKNFANLHSLSYALKDKEPLVYNEFSGKVVDIWALQAANSHLLPIFFKSLEEDAIAFLDDPDLINIVKNRVVGALKSVVEVEESDRNSKYAVICQGDAWTNNVMFRFEDDTLAQSIMIDYQMSKNSGPANDLLYMIFACTDYESRKEHFYDWIDYYYSELDKYLSNYNLKANIVYPREVLDADCKKYAPFLFGLSFMMANTLVRKTDDAAKVMETLKLDDESLIGQVDEMSILILDLETRTLFKNKISGLIKSFSELELL